MSSLFQVKKLCSRCCLGAAQALGPSDSCPVPHQPVSEATSYSRSHSKWQSPGQRATMGKVSAVNSGGRVSVDDHIRQSARLPQTLWVPQLKLRGSSPRSRCQGIARCCERGFRVLGSSLGPKSNWLISALSGWLVEKNRGSGNGEQGQQCHGTTLHLSPASFLSWKDAQTRSTSLSVLGTGLGEVAISASSVFCFWISTPQGRGFFLFC